MTETTGRHHNPEPGPKVCARCGMPGRMGHDLIWATDAKGIAIRCIPERECEPAAPVPSEPMGDTLADRLAGVVQ